MNYYTSLGSRLIRVIDNKETIVGDIYELKLLEEIICLLNDEV